MTSAPRVAIVGAGPAGIYAADILLSRVPNARIDLLEKLPAPYGLVRYGVAPDHPRIRKIIDALHDVLQHPSIRLRANIEVGVDITVDELRVTYDGVILATGADRDMALDLPGADLPGSFGAADLVAWYDAHPDVPRTWPLAAESVAVLGAGNVALDVTRILAKHAADLDRTDTPDEVLDALAANPVRDIHLFARRGPADVRFSALELRELGEQRDVDVIVDPVELELDAHGERMLEQFSQRRIILRTLREWADRPSSSLTASRRIHLHFRQRPVRILGEQDVRGIEMERTASDPLGRMVGTGDLVRHDVGAVYRAIGYRSSAVPGAPFDQVSGVVPHREGRVVDADGVPIPRLYATGWIKRGPIGLIGSTKSDAAQTVQHLVDDLAAPDRIGDGNDRLGDGSDPLAHLVHAVDWTGWLRIDAAERRAGAQRGRERTKLVDRSDMIATATPKPSAVGARLKAAFRTHPAGIAIITAATPSGPVGLTASSVASVAVDPAAIMFSVTRATGSAGALLDADTFAVHLIDDDHADLAQTFATSGADRFTPEQGWVTLDSGEPHLPSARAALRCRALHTIPVGSSTVVIAEVLEIVAGTSGRPLVYLDRRFHSLPIHSERN
ncbi:flavin reductase [Microbacterium sp. AK031]|uniref:flavin reductase n=1 Tax=Microbacterium sp. AK031 TaxID=2723076 RepID=UPI00286E4F63|nr:flavin reductase [Microbacterium sp. AK031]MCS3843345.1 ferredoxin--NADP+ reductase [Microbacterium sp. AK031]